MNIVQVDTKKVAPDENQPRKNFDEGKLGTLMSSIKRFGIKNPLILEVQKDGSYLIIDGERRWRSAVSLGMKEVPAILQPRSEDTVTRIIEQFHLQEMHEAWSPTEKAVVVTRLAHEMDLPLTEIGKILGIGERTINRYVAFGQIIDKKNFERSRVSLDHAERLNTLKNRVKKIQELAGFEFDRTKAKQFENAIYARVRQGGEVGGKSFFTKIGDAIQQNPKILDEFIGNEDMTVEKLFAKTNAKGAYHLRNIITNGRYLASNIHSFMQEKSVKVYPELVKELKNTAKELDGFVKAFEE